MVSAVAAPVRPAYTLCISDTTYKYSFIHKITYDTETCAKKETAVNCSSHQYNLYHSITVLNSDKLKALFTFTFRQTSSLACRNVSSLCGALADLIPPSPRTGSISIFYPKTHYHIPRHSQGRKIGRRNVYVTQLYSTYCTILNYTK